jgi:hypothetical protein
MKRQNEAEWLMLTQRLNAAYATAGQEALGCMTTLDVHVLYTQKQAELRETSKKTDELSQARREKLQWETAAIAGWIKGQQQTLERGLDR